MAHAPELLAFDPAFQRRLRALSLASRRLVHAAAVCGQHRSRNLGPGSEFADYREYSAGDDYRHIDWNAYARSERLLVRLHEQESELSVHVLLDCSGSMADKLGYGLQLTAAIAYVALSHLERLTICAVRDRIAAQVGPLRGLARAAEVLDFLRGLRAEGHTALAPAARAFAAQQPRRGMAILISDLYDPNGALEALDVLRHARFDVRVIRVLAAAELEPDYSGELELVDAETGRRRRMQITPRVLEAYRAARRREADALRHACLARHVPLTVLDPRIAPEDAVLRLLRQAGMFR
ncbi:MAG TPA: DUF58 domain-containing protein [Polyangiales bacterium]|nr:DUF58 domain-containing protein [Polyangiales bacterium]